MKLLIILLSINLYALQPDKRKHIELSSLMGFTNYYATKSVPKSIGYSMLVGVLKELRDSQEANNHFDNKDLKADLVGSVVGTYLGKYAYRYTALKIWVINNKTVIGVSKTW